MTAISKTDNGKTYSYTRGSWRTRDGEVLVADAPPPVPVAVFTPTLMNASVTSLGLGSDGFHMVLDNDETVTDKADIILWICKIVPQPVQLKQLFAKYENGALLQVIGRFSEPDLAALVAAYKPKVIMPVLGDTEISYLRRIFDGEIIRAEMSVLSGAGGATHQRFLEYREIRVEEWNHASAK